MMNEGQDRIKASYRGNYERLVQVKNRYDPDNIFHINQNILGASQPSPYAGLSGIQIAGDELTASRSPCIMLLS